MLQWLILWNKSVTSNVIASDRLTPVFLCRMSHLIMTPYSEYQELDAGPDATIQSRYIKDLVNIQAKATYWDVYCTTDPSAPECKVYDN